MNKPQTMLQAMGNLPKTLYHYTSMSGLLGIVQSEQIWATHIRYLNDRTEQDHIWSLVQTRVNERLAQTNDAKVKLALQRLQTAAGQRPSEDAYVASFSAEGDLLSQWMSYCPQGLGFAIGFGGLPMTINSLAQTKKMSDSLAAGAPFDPGKSGGILPVFYWSPTSDLTTLDYLIDLISGLRSLPELMATFDDVNEPGWNWLRAAFTPANLAFAQITFLESTVKDASFSAEREFRLILRGKPLEVSFRAGKSVVIPYVKYPLDLGDGYLKYPLDLRGGYFIERVIVGPCPEPDLSVKSLKMLFESLGHPSVEIIKSSIPYRGW